MSAGYVDRKRKPPNINRIIVCETLSLFYGQILHSFMMRHAAALDHLFARIKNGSRLPYET